ncbi:Sec23/Sec24 trunk domain-containing protein [Hysterangium stoloniferum]|nr:Sec23/Sec24 trunk domain-containing protein [Hysterangium stoloniferum]
MDRHIRQPPHSAGQPFKGLRSRIDPSQIPSPITVADDDQSLWATQSYMTCAAQLPVPLSSSEFHAIDQGNSTPRFVRLTTYTVPDSANLASACEIPLGAFIRPFAEEEEGEELVPLVDFGDVGPPRCSQPWCRAYINPWCIFTHNGFKWQCNICESETEVSSHYYSVLDSDLRRIDHLQRPELTRGTVDFAVSEEYWAPPARPRIIPSYYSATPPSTTKRVPQPMRYLFVIDVSQEAITSGFVQSVCEGLINVFYGTQSPNEIINTSIEPPLCFPPENEISIMTYDHTLHFYNLSSNREQATMHVVSDIDEVFLPLYEEMFVLPSHARHIIEPLLKSIPRRFTDTTVRGGCLGSAVCASLASLAGRGGQVTMFISSLPTLGGGFLAPREQEESALYGTDKEKELFMPRGDFWRDMAEECADEGVGVNYFLAPMQPIDIGMIGIVPSVTGGEMFFYPRYTCSLDEDAMLSQLRRVVFRQTAYNCSMRVRCSQGLRVSRYSGNLQQRSSTDVDLATCDADKTICATLEHTGIPMDERRNAYLQSAMLYTTSSGERRVRTCNIALPVSSLAGNIFRRADQESVVVYWSKLSVAAMTSKSLRNIRDDLTRKCTALLLAYRRNCAASSAPSQLILPEQFKLLPLYTLSILKTRRNVVSDVRNYHAHKMTSYSVVAMMRYLYPKLLALHDLTDDICSPDPTTGRIQLPSLMRSSYVWMESNGLYLIDNGEQMILWIGASISPQLLKDLYAVETIQGLDIRNTRIPPGSSTLISEQVRQILAHREMQRRRRTKLVFARQDLDAAEIDFSDMLVEDQNNDGMSYVDYLCFIHKQINTAVSVISCNVCCFFA